MTTAAHSTAGAHRGQAAGVSCKWKREFSNGERTGERKYGLDLDNFECPICLELFSPPVYQCHNGHPSCSACCGKLISKECPTCTLPTGSIRCIAIEKILESLVVSCKYAEHGCTKMLKQTGIEEHETYCDYELFRCPVPECIHKGSQGTLSVHLAKEHHVRIIAHKNNTVACFTMDSTDRFMLLQVDDEDDEGTQTLYLVHHEIHEILVDVFFCTCFGGYYHEIDNLKVKHKMGCLVPHSMDNASACTDIRRMGEYWKEDFLLLPNKQEGPNLSFEVHFRVTNRFDN